MEEFGEALPEQLPTLWEMVMKPLEVDSKGGYVSSYFCPTVLLSHQGSHRLEKYLNIQGCWECSGSVVECLTRDQGAGGSSLIGVTRCGP